MTETEFQLIRGAGFLLALGFATVAQRTSPHARLHGSWRVNGVFWIINLLVIGVVCGACACTVARWAAAQDYGFFRQVRVPAWMAAAGTIVVLDLVSYLWHRANHTIPFLWRFHQAHHSDPSFTASTALRFHPGELLLSLPLRLSAVVALGASPTTVVLFEVLFTVANLFEHGDIDLPRAVESRLERLCITPALHRLHHSRQRSELNSNFGTVFTLWDRAFGSYHRASSQIQVDTGLPYEASAETLWEVFSLPIRSGPFRGP